ncbi:PAS domain S-box [Marinomonas fungiae]|uniref:PAS domain S-box n=1 Tax=Marinomonas fungiae TaxID=1137284 RepID=A0A0K6IJB3_9GAMM|nr:PAS domain S-box [Marinomonas fungiae]
MSFNGINVQISLDTFLHFIYAIYLLSKKSSSQCGKGDKRKISVCFFQSRKTTQRIAELEHELAVFQSIRQDLMEEMLYFAVDRQGSIIEANAHFLSSCGFQLHELGQISHHISKKAQNSQHTQAMLDAIRNGEHWHGAMQFIGKDGEDHWYRVIMQPVPVKNSKCLTAYCVEPAQPLSRSLRS